MKETAPIIGRKEIRHESSNDGLLGKAVCPMWVEIEGFMFCRGLITMDLAGPAFKRAPPLVGVPQTWMAPYIRKSPILPMHGKVGGPYNSMSPLPQNIVTFSTPPMGYLSNQNPDKGRLLAECGGV